MTKNKIILLPRCWGKHMLPSLCRTYKETFTIFVSNVYRFWFAKKKKIDVGLDIRTFIPVSRIWEALLVAKKDSWIWELFRERSRPLWTQLKRWKQDNKKPTVRRIGTERQLLIDTSLSACLITMELGVWPLGAYWCCKGCQDRM